MDEAQEFIPTTGEEPPVEQPPVAIEDASQDPEAEIVSQLEEIQQLSALDYAKKYGKYVAGAAVVGAAAWYLYKRGHRHIEIPDGHTVAIAEDVRHLPGVVSLVKLPKKGEIIARKHLAVSLPIEAGVAEELKRKGRNISLFAMKHLTDKGEPEEVAIAYPLRSDDERHVKKYARATKEAASWLLSQYRLRKDSKQ